MSAKTCLLVDDARTVRSAVKRMLAENAFTIREAEDGIEALAAVQNEMPDWILLDWNMPRMDGLECLKQLRALPAGAQPKIIFCTTENTPEQIERAILAGADEYIMKPFDKEILHMKLQQVGVL